MPLGSDTLGKLCDFALAGASALAPALGIPSTAIDLIAKGGTAALALRKDQRDAYDVCISRVRKTVERDFGSWLERDCGRDWQRRADVEAAFAELDTVLPHVGLDSATIAAAGHNADAIVATLRERLPASSLIRLNDTAARVFETLISGAFTIVRSDSALSAELTSLSFERVFEEFKRAEDSQERRHIELLHAIARERGVDPKHLRPLFEAVGHDANISHDRYEQAIRSAVEELLTRARDPVAPSNDGEAIDAAIHVARAKLKDLDIIGAIEHLQAERARQAEERTSRAKGEARLALEEADIRRIAYQYDEAIAAYDEAALLDPDNLRATRMSGQVRLGIRPLAEALDAFERFRKTAERLGNDREISVAHNAIGDVRVAQGDLADALTSYEASHAIRERLAAGDPRNSGWQRDLSVSRNRIGDVRVAQGDLAGALTSYEAGLAIAERLAAADLRNSEWQRDLSISHNKIGDVRVAQGDLAGALTSYEVGLAIAERLAAADPRNSGWQRDLSVSHNRIGDVCVAQGDLAGALTSYEASHAIFERLAAADPRNTGWQHDLSVSRDRIGDVCVAQGDLAGALTSYEVGLAIREHLAVADPSNSGWHRDLSISHNKIGGVRVAQGDLAGALTSYEAGLAIAERLAAGDPRNSEWQHDLSVSHDRIGNVRVAQGDLAGALTSYEVGLAIRERLAAADPRNSEWQRDLSVSHNKIGGVRVAQGDLTGALASYEASHAIFERLAAGDSRNSGWQRDLIVSHWKLAAAGQSATEHYSAALAIARDLQDSGRLAPGDQWFVADLEKLLDIAVASPE